MRLHEEGHSVLGHAKNYPQNWLSDEAVMMARLANKHALDKMGISVESIQEFNSIANPNLVNSVIEIGEYIESQFIGPQQVPGQKKTLLPHEMTNAATFVTNAPLAKEKETQRFIDPAAGNMIQAMVDWAGQKFGLMEMI